MGAIAKVSPRSRLATSKARTNELALELCNAAFDADEATAKQALADLLKRPGRRSDEEFQARHKAIENLFLTLRSMVLIDELTSLYNRRGFMRTGSRLLDTVRRNRHGALLLYFDVDNLKDVNDTGGHAAGDAILVQAGQVLRSVFRHRDIVGRLGGDEFAVLAACSDPMGSEIIIERFEEALEASNAASAPPYLSLSVGVAKFDPEEPLSLAALMQRADVVMYGNKMAKLFTVHRNPFSKNALPLDRSSRKGVGHSSSAPRA